MARAPIDLLPRAKALPQRLAFFCQQLTGDAAYDRFCAHLRANHPAMPVPTREAFYRERLEEKWAGIVRCC